MLYQSTVEHDVCFQMDALIRELFDNKGFASPVFEACMDLQKKKIKPKDQSEILLQHALANRYPGAFVMQLNGAAFTAFSAAKQSRNVAERPPQKATAMAWYFQSQIRKLWSRYYAKQSSEKNLAEQLVLRRIKRQVQVDNHALAAINIYSRRLTATAARLQQPPVNLDQILSTFAIRQRSGRLRKLSASSPAPIFANEVGDNLDWLATVFEFDPLDGPGDAGGVVPGEGELPHGLSDGNDRFVSGNNDGGFELPDLEF
ncbi:MAG: hypothetical protein CL678_17525 [Bdellovibrionaceae bacterium]|nr:hypothetical protein [Pseudobdellovibrionaceae bacterium]